VTAPNQSAPDGAYVIGTVDDVEDWDEASIRAVTKAPVINAFTEAENQQQTRILTPIDDNLTLALIAQGDADDALTQAQLAANAAAAAEEAAEIAVDVASYWESECVVASAAVVLGVNELLIGLCQNVPAGRTRYLTNLHFALHENIHGLTIQTKKWDATGATSTVIHTATLGANVTRIEYPSLGIQMFDKERIFWNVTSISGPTNEPPEVLQVLAFGTII